VVGGQGSAIDREALAAGGEFIMDIFTLLRFIAGLVLLILGGESLVRGASRLAAAIGISPLVIGLTVVAIGTGSPELAVCIQSALGGQSEIALGNVVGSNICNVLLVLGVSALAAPLMVSRQLVRLDVPLMIAASILLFLLSLDGHLGLLDGLLLTSGIVAYTFFAIYQSRKESRDKEALPSDKEGGKAIPMARSTSLSIALVILGIFLLVYGSRWLVSGAVEIAQLLGVSELIIGLTIVALGTSLPEITTSLIATLRGQRDMAIGNVVGSNIFNILAVLGLCSIAAPGGIGVPTAALRFDIPIMITVALACLPMFFTGNVIARWEGALFFGYYLAYTAFLILSASHHSALPLFSRVMMSFIIPLTFITLLLLFLRALRRGGREQRR
jgi:cation:H+ antiporter